MLEEEGFDVEVSSYRLPFLFIIIALRKLLATFESDKTPTSDLKPIPSSLNSLLLMKHRGENTLVYNGISLPFGSSLFIVARKK